MGSYGELWRKHAAGARNGSRTMLCFQALNAYSQKLCILVYTLQKIAILSHRESSSQHHTSCSIFEKALHLLQIGLNPLREVRYIC